MVATSCFRRSDSALEQAKTISLKCSMLRCPATEASLAPNPDELLERHQAAQLVYEVLDTLPEKYRTVLILSQLEELPAEAIADLTGIKSATVAAPN